MTEEVGRGGLQAGRGKRLVQRLQPGDKTVGQKPAHGDLPGFFLAKGENAAGHIQTPGAFPLPVQEKEGRLGDPGGSGQPLIGAGLGVKHQLQDIPDRRALDQDAQGQEIIRGEP